jgi:hypothetical protein
MKHLRGYNNIEGVKSSTVPRRAVVNMRPQKAVFEVQIHLIAPIAHH